MRVYHISALFSDLEDIYDGLKKALDYLGQNYIGKTKNEIRKALKELEKVKPYLRHKDDPTRSGLVRKK